MSYIPIIGGEYGIRTHLISSVQARCPLQADPFPNLVEITGLEPVTFRLSAECSNQLSYISVLLVENMGFEPIWSPRCKRGVHSKQTHSPNLVEITGLEPVTAPLSGECSTNWAIFPFFLVENMGFEPIWYSRCQRDVHSKQTHSPNLVEITGLEPVTFRLSAERSNQLSYISVFWWRHWESNSVPRLAKPRF